jgi:hypothetical protein
MARIGIIGSSFSQGGQPYYKNIKKKYRPTVMGQNNCTLFFDEHLKKHLPQHDFFNVALSGRGSERFLDNIINLKKLYNIDAVLIENIEDRRHNIIFNNLPVQEEILKNIEKNSHFRSYYSEKFSLEHYLDSSIANKNSKDVIIGTILESIPIKKVKNWLDVQFVIYLTDNMNKILGVKNVENTESLCKILEIKTIHWSHRQENYFRNDFGVSAKSYIEKNWGSFEQYSSDGTHCNDHAVDKLCQEYFKLLIENVL